MSEQFLELKIDHRAASKYLIEKLEQKGFKLNYDDDWDGYTEIDLKKDSRKYYVVIIEQNNQLKISASVSSWFFLFKRKSKIEETIKFLELVKNILEDHQDIN